MIKLVENKFEFITCFCKEYKVKNLVLFGSAVDEKKFDDQKSDLDFLVEFLPMEPVEHSRAYFKLLESLQDLFMLPVDLVEIKAVHNPYLLQSINKNQRQIYAA